MCVSRKRVLNRSQMRSHVVEGRPRLFFEKCGGSPEERGKEGRERRARSWSVPWWSVPSVHRPLLFRRQRRQREGLPGRNGRGEGSARPRPRRGGGGRSPRRHLHARRRRCGAGTGARAHQRRYAVSLFSPFFSSWNHIAIWTPANLCAARLDRGPQSCSNLVL